MWCDVWKVVAIGLIVAVMFVACGWDPKKPFERYSSEVDQAVVDIDSGRPREVRDKFGKYVFVFWCDGGVLAVLGVADVLNAVFDLGLTLFKFVEQYGRKFDDAVVYRDGGFKDGEK